MVSATDIKTQDHPALRGPGCQARMQAGLMVGLVIGVTIGGLYGGSQALRYGVSGREFVRVVGRSMFSVGGVFGTFMCVGALLRC
ncbi:hypothetical protein PGB90_007073 [Kerria lacca]